MFISDWMTASGAAGLLENSPESTGRMGFRQADGWQSMAVLFIIQRCILYTMLSYIHVG